MKNNKKDVCVIGGCGHVGLPLALCFSDKGLKVNIYDINEKSIKMVNNGVMPFLENGCEKLLKNNTMEGGKNPWELKTLYKTIVTRVYVVSQMTRSPENTFFYKNHKN